MANTLDDDAGRFEEPNPNETKKGFDKFFDHVPPAVCFGLVIGFMAALSTYAGTATALIGLLFVLVGREAMSWFKPEVNQHRDEFFRLIGLISIGIFAGLWIGFLAKSYERASIEASFKSLQKEINSLKISSATSEEVEAIVQKQDDLLKKAGQPVVVLQSFVDQINQLNLLANRVKEVSSQAGANKDQLDQFAKNLRIAGNLKTTYIKKCEILDLIKEEELANEIRSFFESK